MLLLELRYHSVVVVYYPKVSCQRENQRRISLLGDRRLLVGHNLTGASLIKLICEDIPFNFKQRLVVEQVQSEALAWKDQPDGESKKATIPFACFGGSRRG